MRFVHREERDARFRQGDTQFFTRQGFRRGHHQQGPALGDAFHRLSSRLAAHCAIDANNGHAAFFEITGLILEQSKERRDHHHRLGENHRGDLVTG